MQIILLESLNKLGKAGDIVSVKDGYANNYLIPHKKAIVANKKNKSDLEGRMAEINSNNQKKLEEAKIIKSKLDGTSIKIIMESNDEGILYGAVTQKQILESLRSKEIDIKTDMIVLIPIKSLGEYDVKIRIYEEIESVIQVIVSKK